jgi:hypothetical protein
MAYPHFTRPTAIPSPIFLLHWKGLMALDPVGGGCCLDDRLGGGGGGAVWARRALASGRSARCMDHWRRRPTTVSLGPPRHRGGNPALSPGSSAGVRLAPGAGAAGCLCRARSLGLRRGRDAARRRHDPCHSVAGLGAGATNCSATMQSGRHGRRCGSPRRARTEEDGGRLARPARRGDATRGRWLV